MTPKTHAKALFDTHWRNLIRGVGMTMDYWDDEAKRIFGLWCVRMRAEIEHALNCEESGDQRPYVALCGEIEAMPTWATARIIFNEIEYNRTTLKDLENTIDCLKLLSEEWWNMLKNSPLRGRHGCFQQWVFDCNHADTMDDAHIIAHHIRLLVLDTLETEIISSEAKTHDGN